MLIRFMNHGTGSGAVAAEYLTQALDWKGQEREDIQALRGDPGQVADVADSLKFKHKYTSAVIAWAPEDQPTDEQIERTVDEFEKFAWAGMAPDRYAWTAVKHRDSNGGGVHVHVVAARYDLATGKSLNIAPPNWERQYASLRDCLNQEYGWSSPKDPARARAVRPGHQAYIEKERPRLALSGPVISQITRAADESTERAGQQFHRAGVAITQQATASPAQQRQAARIDKALIGARLVLEKHPRRLITGFLLQEIERGTVTDRASLVEAVKQTGLTVPRQGKDYLTVEDPGSGGRWRLKGAIYGHGFQRERFIREARRSQPREGAGVRAGAPGERRSAHAELNRHQRNRARYLRQRYPVLDHVDERGGGGVAGWLILIGLSLGLGIYGAHKLAIRWTEREVQSLTSRKAALQAEIEAQKTTIKQLTTKTWGILLYEEESGRYVVFPKGQFGDDGTDWTFGGRPALKLKDQ